MGPMPELIRWRAMFAEARVANRYFIRWIQGHWRVLVLAFLLLAVGVTLTKSLMRAVRDLDRLPVHGQYSIAEGFLRGDIGSMRQVRESLLDHHGVLQYDYGGELGHQYNPLFIADFAMSLVSLWDDLDGRRILLANLDYIVASAVKTPAGHSVFPFLFDFPVVGQKAPWFSAMAQARVGQALMWGWRLTGDLRYLTEAKNAILAMTDTSQKPPLSKPLARGVWLKEFPGYRFNVLDGSLVAIVGVREVWKGLPENDPDRESLDRLFTDAIAGFKSNQGCFTSPFGGVYFDDAGKTPSQSYYDIIMIQLQYLSAVDREIKSIADRYSVASMSGARRLGLAWWLRMNRWFFKHSLCVPCIR
jgi:hypothetical protein